MDRRTLFKAAAGAIAAVFMPWREVEAEEPWDPWEPWESTQGLESTPEPTLLDHIDAELLAIRERGEEAVRLYMRPGVAEEWDELVFGRSYGLVPEYVRRLYYASDTSDLKFSVPMEVQDSLTATFPVTLSQRRREEYEWEMETIQSLPWNEHGFVFATRPKRTGVPVWSEQGVLESVTYDDLRWQNTWQVGEWNNA